MGVAIHNTGQAMAQGAQSQRCRDNFLTPTSFTILYNLPQKQEEEIVLMASRLGRLPHLTHIDRPHTVLELADLSDFHSARVLPQFDLVVWADIDPFSAFLQNDICFWANRPFANPLPMP